jgi:hypothetical protein
VSANVPSTSRVDEYSASRRAWTAFVWSLKLLVAGGVLGYMAWQMGCETDQSGTPRESEEFLNIMILYAVAGPFASVVVAVFKPWCTSYSRCVVIAFLACLPLLLCAALMGSDPADRSKIVAEALSGSVPASLVAGWMLWQYAKQGADWRWPFKEADDP